MTRMSNESNGTGSGANIQSGDVASAATHLRRSISFSLLRATFSQSCSHWTEADGARLQAPTTRSLLEPYMDAAVCQVKNRLLQLR